jgi:deoxyribodipyrimidine photolyase-related protein
MSQFAAGSKITTKPYISGSNYIFKMSDYKKATWAEDWDGLYWSFVDDYRDIIKRNYRMQMVVTLYDKFDADKKQRLRRAADKYLQS